MPAGQGEQPSLTSTAAMIGKPPNAGDSSGLRSSAAMEHCPSPRLRSFNRPTAKYDLLIVVCG